VTRAHRAIAAETGQRRAPLPAVAPALALATTVGNQAFTRIVARAPAATAAELSPEDVERVTGMVVPKLEVAAGLLRDAAGRPLSDLVPSAIGHLEPVLPVLQVLDPAPGSEAERVIRAETACIKDEIAILKALLVGGPSATILPHWTGAYAKAGEILQQLDPESRGAYLLEHSVMPAIESALREIGSPDMGRIAWDQLSTLKLIQTAAEDEQLEGYPMAAVADDFRRGIQVTLAITGEPGDAVERSASIIDIACSQLGGIGAPRREPSRRAPIGIPEGEVPAERRPFPGIGPFP
jgi:hypothetical protein